MTHLSIGSLTEQNLRLATALLQREGEVQRLRRRLAALGQDPGPRHGKVEGPPPCLRPFDQCEHVFHCPVCGAGSCAPGDAEQGYCGNCGYVGTGDIQKLRRELLQRTREWQDEQRSRLDAEQARFVADQRADRAERRAQLVHERQDHLAVQAAARRDDDQGEDAHE